MNNTDDNRNMIYFLIASMVLLFGYQFFIGDKQQKQIQAQHAAAAAAASSSSMANLAAGLTANGTLTRDQALAASPRVPIDTPAVKGSIALKGALIDDLSLVRYSESVDSKTPVELLRPAGSDHAFYVQSGYNGQNIPNMPGPETLWTLASGTVLSPGKPVLLTYDNGAGLRFQRTLSIDDNYMISEDDQVTNAGGQPVAIAPYSMVVRQDMPAGAGKSAYVFEGAIATSSKSTAPKSLSDYHTQSITYRDLSKTKNPKAIDKAPSVGGWYGITDKYWMAAVIPDQKQAVQFTAKATALGNHPIFTSAYVGNPVTLAAGTAWTGHTRVFAGAKLYDTMKTYEKSQSIPRFADSIDWGHLGFITYPFFLLLTWLYGVTKNYGLAILAMTVIVKIVFYPLAHRSYESMTKMKAVQQHLQPKLDAIKKRFPDDPQKQQEETMKLYQQEKVNPMAGLSGCLPMLLQIPVFICLVKVLYLDIGLRHAPFFGWIHDLSAPDPLSFVNLFGLLPFDPAAVPVIGGFLAGPLHLGPVAILYGLSMWLSQQMTPMTGVDPMQKKMMAFMPLMMVFFFSQLAIGLMIYYLWNNILTMLQQYSIMRRLKVENPIDDLIAKITGKSEPKKAA